jgi:hypothetical protein
VRKLENVRRWGSGLAPTVPHTAENNRKTGRTIAHKSYGQTLVPGEHESLASPSYVRENASKPDIAKDARSAPQARTYARHPGIRGYWKLRCARLPSWMTKGPRCDDIAQFVGSCRRDRFYSCTGARGKTAAQGPRTDAWRPRPRTTSGSLHHGRCQANNPITSVRANLRRRSLVSRSAYRSPVLRNGSSMSIESTTH